MLKENVYMNLIDGQWIQSETGITFECVNPANQEIIGYAQKSNENDMQKAIDSAKKAYIKSDWRRDPNLRYRVMIECASLLEQHKGELAHLLTLNNGKTIGEAESEISSCIDGFQYYAGLTRNMFGRSINPSEDSLAVLCREPMGVVGIISPWNWPAWLMVRAMAPALAAGNAVVIKPASYTAAINMKVISILSQVKELPKGIVNAVSGPGGVVGELLAKSEKVNMIDFTGDAATGEKITIAAARTVKKVSLELGGKSPNVIFDDANLNKAIPGAIWAFLFTSGQLCMAGTRLVVQDTIYDEVLKRLKVELEKLKVGNGLDERSHMGPLVSEDQLNTVMKYIELGKKEGKLLTGGFRLTGGDYDKGFFVPPTVFTDLPRDSKLVQEEIFGPVLVVQKFHTEEEAIEIANDTRYGLAGAVWTNDVSRAVRVAREIEAGTVWINTYNKFYTEAEFGGYKLSGVGRTHGVEALLECTEIKHINFDIKPTYF